MDVIRDQAIVGLSKNNVDVLTVNLQATSDRFEIGDLTRTDVAQSGSRLALARGDLRTAQANLIASRERYIQVVGKAPVDLQPPPPLPGLPANPDDAVDVALATNPDLLAAKQRSKAAGYDIEVAGSGRLPRLSVFTSGDYTNYLGTLGGNIGSAFAQTATTAQAGVRATIPIFQGGRPAAQERRAQAQAAATSKTRSRSNAMSSPRFAAPFPRSPPRPRSSPPTRPRSTPPRSASKACAPRTASATGRSSTSSMPSRNCCARRSSWSPRGATPMSPASRCSPRWAGPRPTIWGSMAGRSTIRGQLQPGQEQDLGLGDGPRSGRPVDPHRRHARAGCIYSPTVIHVGRITGELARNSRLR